MPPFAQPPGAPKFSLLHSTRLGASLCVLKKSFQAGEKAQIRLEGSSPRATWRRKGGRDPGQLSSRTWQTVGGFLDPTPGSSPTSSPWTNTSLLPERRVELGALMPWHGSRIHSRLFKKPVTLGDGANHTDSISQKRGSIDLPICASSSHVNRRSQAGLGPSLVQLQARVRDALARRPGVSTMNQSLCSFWFTSARMPASCQSISRYDIG